MEEQKISRPRRTSEQMYPLVAQWQGSGQSKRQFCADHGLNLHTFNYWLDKYRRSHRPTTDSNFLAVSVAPSATLPPTGVHLRYLNGVELHVHHPLTPTELLTLLQLPLSC